MATETRELQERIVAECDRQYGSVRFTHQYGKYISQGINASRSAIQSIPTDIDPLEFLRRAMHILDSVSSSVDAENDDEDGWAMGGVGTIRRFVMEERRAIERATASTRDAMLDALRESLNAAFDKDRAEVLRRQTQILLLDPLDTTEPNRGVCSWCRNESPTHRFESMRQICLSCCLLFYPNLVEASNGKQIPAIGMVIADVSRALRAAAEPGAERIIAELERRASARRSRHPRGFLPACDGCAQAFERVQWTASLPGVDLCDRCVRHATEVLSFV